VAAEQIPYIQAGFAQFYDSTGAFVQEILRNKLTQRALTGGVAYPFSRSQRVEFTAGLEQYSYASEIRFTGFDPNTGAVLYDSTHHLPVPGALTLETTSAALVYDNSFFGATGPILGSRWRIEADPTFGSLRFVTALADFRKYIVPARPFTLAARVMHVGRYGRDAEGRIYPLFIGYPGLVRGYDYGSFDTGECGNTSGTTCPVFDQLFGSKFLIGNVELRFPPFGLLGIGGGYYGILPVDAAIFYDAGVAWTDSAKAQIFGGTRKLVRSTGLTFRMNLLGYAIGQMDIVHPFDRPQKNWMVRLSITEGF
jgi:outer membrane protein assembly factor BamA